MCCVLSLPCAVLTITLFLSVILKQHTVYLSIPLASGRWRRHRRNRSRLFSFSFNSPPMSSPTPILSSPTVKLGYVLAVDRCPSWANEIQSCVAAGCSILMCCTILLTRTWAYSAPSARNLLDRVSFRLLLHPLCFGIIYDISYMAVVAISTVTSRSWHT